MRYFWKDLLYACVIGLIVPAMILSVGVAIYGEEALPEPTVAVIMQESTQVRIPVLTQAGLEDMLLDEYLTGVVLAEMPASFETEAHKAQAVVARTYTMRAYRDKPRHDSACVCTDSTCCQGYISAEDYISRGGSSENVQKIRAAVYDTAGLVLTYDGELIEATYFSCSGGSTEDAVAVWGTDVPYLKSVKSPGEEQAAHYSDTVTFTGEEFLGLLEIEGLGDPANWVGDYTLTAGGGVDRIWICEQVFSGSQVRKLLGLRSTAFQINWEDDHFIVSTRGFGHRVGMSQYGADAMALSGNDFRQILSHYYQGTVLTTLAD